MTIQPADGPAWSLALSQEYTVGELEAMNAWLDVHLDLNQQRLESLTTRLGVVITLAVANIALIAATVESSATVFTVLACVASVISTGLAAAGLTRMEAKDNDPTTTWDTMWTVRQPGELQAALYSTRSVLFHNQRALIRKRADSMKSSSWVLGGAGLLTAVAILVSRLA